MTTETSSMSKPQKDYAIYKALFDTIKAKVDIEKKPVHQALDAGTISVDQWAEQTTTIEYKYGYWKAFDLLVEDFQTVYHDCLVSGDWLKAHEHDLVYHSYVFNRQRSPDIKPEEWSSIFPNFTDLEERYQREREATNA